MTRGFFPPRIDFPRLLACGRHDSSAAVSLQKSCFAACFSIVEIKNKSFSENHATVGAAKDARDSPKMNELKMAQTITSLIRDAVCTLIMSNTSGLPKN